MKKLRKGDLVKVIAGRSKGQQGKVLGFTKDGMRVFVEGVNLVSKFVKKGMFGKGQPGQIIKKPASIHISNVRLICPKCGKPVGVKILVENGKKFRVCKKCGIKIDFYAASNEDKVKKQAGKSGKNKLEKSSKI